eukprot:552842_1
MLTLLFTILFTLTQSGKVEFIRRRLLGKNVGDWNAGFNPRRLLGKDVPRRLLGKNFGRGGRRLLGKNLNRERRRLLGKTIRLGERRLLGKDIDGRRLLQNPSVPLP